ncbi:EthD family reductase [Bosea sp. 47.2.35]|uniref:EthD domain-containing protein n=1 Tax=Bosea sp. 47.2.35 TaxID=2969304 RepID=UPI00214F970B|nr:EthD family reductase [Bosea sp. 47.2.35]MCR4522196.1 EthD family reductase [Bosea sp. 47.2.35]
MRKIVTLLKRAPGLSVQEFQRRWSQEHGPLAAAAPGVRRYVQSHALEKGYAKGELLFDGISEAWFDDDAAVATHDASEAARRVAADVVPLVDPSRLVRMAVDVHVIKDGPAPEPAVKNIEFVNRRPGMPLAPFRDYWRSIHGPLAATIPVLRRYEQNHLALSQCETGEHVYDGLAITWFDSTADMKAGTLTAEYVATRADEPNFLPDGHLPIIITREVFFG